MEPTLWSAAGILTAGVVTPGPNNLVVLREAMRGGWRAALPMSLGIVSGGLALLLLATAGVASVFSDRPVLQAVVTGFGAAYLLMLGVRLAFASSDAKAEDRTLPTGVWGLFVFQFLNPKAWVLALTVTAAAQSSMGLAALPPLAVLFVMIPAASLSAWIWAGSRLGDRFRGGGRLWLDRTMGALLALCAAILLAGVLR